MKIGVFSGSFNPPTLAHLEIVEEAFKFFNCDKVLLIPVHNHRDKQYDTSFEQRLNMCNLTFTNPNVEILEDEYKFKGKTYDLMKHLKSQYPNDELNIMIGSDCANDLKSWYRGKDLINENKFIIFTRNDDVGPEELLNNDRSNFITNNSFLSSTFIRNNIEQAKNYCVDKVYNYIKNEGIYQ